MDRLETIEYYKMRLSMPDINTKIKMREAYRNALEALEQVDNLEEQIRILQNRCEFFTKGELCMSCEIQNCQHKNKYYSETGGTYVPNGNAKNNSKTF